MRANGKGRANGHGLDGEASSKSVGGGASSSAKAGSTKAGSGALPTPQTGPSFSPGRLSSMATLEKLRGLVAPHIESFDFFLTEGLSLAIRDIPPQEFKISENGSTLRMWYQNAAVGNPILKLGQQQQLGGKLVRLLPRECRERGLTYAAPFSVLLSYQVDGGQKQTMERTFGDLPIMVGSQRCHLRGSTPAQLVRMREEDCEMGGYFIISGLERCMRLLQVPRRNYPMALARSSFRSRGLLYSDLAVTMRCARRDQSTATVNLHYLLSGGAMLRFVLRKQEFLVPVVLVMRALYPITDRDVFTHVMQGQEDNTALAARTEVLLRDAARYGPQLQAHSECLGYIGSRFRYVMRLPENLTDQEVGRAVIDRHILVHLDKHADKLDCLLLMLRKLYLFAQGACREDNADALSAHELLLPGHVYAMYVKEKLEECLLAVRQHLQRDARQNPARAAAAVRDPKAVARLVDKYGALVGARVATLLGTGNLQSSTGLDLQQASGFTIVAERINFLRYLSHFRAVHRGQFFTTMKTTTVRKLLPESWGFLCPVHTPDGEPCGLLNHLAAECKVICTDPKPLPAPARPLPEVLAALGVTPGGLGGGDGQPLLPRGYLPVMLDGKVYGGASAATATAVAAALRSLKVASPPVVEPTLEVALVPPPPAGASLAGPFPGLFLFTRAARLLRPVLQLASGRREWIGPLEQVFMEVACTAGDVRTPSQKLLPVGAGAGTSVAAKAALATTHRELDPTNMLSVVASLTPFSDCNQSPRNMYQCQMGKQSMGTAAHSLTPHRTDNKMYRLLFPQAPLVQTRRQAHYCLDDYPQGMNAVVAVLSYTGYDMEDAMILCKASYERGFGHASVHKTATIDLLQKNVKAAAANPQVWFANTAPGTAAAAVPPAKLTQQQLLHPQLDADGLPLVGQWLKEGDPVYCVVDELAGKVKVTPHKDSEMACVETVRISNRTGRAPCASITLRYPRNPVIGDKFSSRHGQKGVLSVLWPQQDMPFTESGMSPDIIINPHAFPSRMTIGMLVESMAGKAGALHGAYQDATPFRFHEGNRVIDHFGRQLTAAGYAYHGSEPLYSGLTGQVMHADIFVGLVYYQRLRHMVSDKSQVRATGPVHQLTKQPVKGRKNRGGIRFGEMERDSLLSHGAAFLLHDRLMNCSDRHVAHVCNNCGSLLTTAPRKGSVLGAGRNVTAAAAAARKDVWCRACESSEHVKAVALPYVFRYLANELAGMNIRLTMELS